MKYVASQDTQKKSAGITQTPVHIKAKVHQKEVKRATAKARKENTPHANIAVAPIIPAKNAGIKKGKAERGNEPEKFKAAFEMLLPCTRKKSEEEKTKGIQDLE